MITNEEQYSYDKVKWLADIPILGKLFQSKTFSGGETELVIFVTPRIMNNLQDGINREELERADSLIEKFEEQRGGGLLD